MSDTQQQNDAIRALESRDELTGTFEVNGEEMPLTVQEPTLDELEAIEDGLDESADETDAIREMADRSLVGVGTPPQKPDVGSIGVSKLFALFDGMRETWQQSDAFDAAEGQMPLEQEGNSQRSRR